jgi:hypothetical protein
MMDRAASLRDVASAPASATARASQSDGRGVAPATRSVQSSDHAPAIARLVTGAVSARASSAIARGRPSIAACAGAVDDMKRACVVRRYVR